MVIPHASVKRLMFALSFDEGAFLSVVFIGFEVSLDSVFFYKKLVFSARFSVTKKNDSTIPPNPPKHSHIPRMATQKKKVRSISVDI